MDWDKAAREEIEDLRDTLDQTKVGGVVPLRCRSLCKGREPQGLLGGACAQKVVTAVVGSSMHAMLEDSWLAAGVESGQTPSPSVVGSSMHARLWASDQRPNHLTI